MTPKKWVLNVPANPDSLSLERTIEKLLLLSRHRRPNTFVINFSDTLLLDQMIITSIQKLLNTFEVLGAKSAVSGISPNLSASLTLLDYSFSGTVVCKSFEDEALNSSN